jgi:hypothetical protein
MKRTLILVFLLGIISWASAVLVEDFDSYDFGPVWQVASPPWNGIFSTTSLAYISHPGYYSWACGVWAGADNGHRGMWRSLGGNSIRNTDPVTTVFLRMSAVSMSHNSGFGLSDIAAPYTFSDFEVQITCVNGQLNARNGNTFVPLGISLRERLWYNIWLVVDNASDTYDVYVTSNENASEQHRVAENCVFRNSVNGPVANDLITFLTLAVQNSGALAIDDIHITDGIDLTVPSGCYPYNIVAEDIGSGQLRISCNHNPWCDNEGNAFKGLAFKVVLEDAFVQSEADVLEVRSSFNYYPDYFSEMLDYGVFPALGEGTPLANSASPGIAAFPATTFDVSLGHFEPTYAYIEWCDLDGDEEITLQDLYLFSFDWMEADAAADFNLDHRVNFADYVLMMEWVYLPDIYPNETVIVLQLHSTGEPAANVRILPSIRQSGTISEQTVSVVFPRYVSVPDLTGMDVGQASWTLHSVELQPSELLQGYSATVPVGHIISQSPAAGTMVPSGTNVNMVVSMGIIEGTIDGSVEIDTSETAYADYTCTMAGADVTADVQWRVLDETYCSFDAVVPGRLNITTLPVGAALEVRIKALSLFGDVIADLYVVLFGEGADCVPGGASISGWSSQNEGTTAEYGLYKDYVQWFYDEPNDTWYPVWCYTATLTNEATWSVENPAGNPNLAVFTSPGVLTIGLVNQDELITIHASHPTEGDFCYKTLVRDIPDSPPFAGGDGSTEYPYLISTAQDIEFLTRHSYYYDKHFLLIDDIDFNGQIYNTALISPIYQTDCDRGYSLRSFPGVFDGNGHTIRNLTIQSNSDYFGLFGSVGSSGVVKNVHLDNVLVQQISISYGRQLPAVLLQVRIGVRNCSMCCHQQLDRWR